MIKKVITIILFLLLILAPEVVLDSVYMRCIIPKGTMVITSDFKMFTSSKNQIIYLKKLENEKIATFPLKGFINKEYINLEGKGFVAVEYLENCIEYDEEI